MDKRFSIDDFIRLREDLEQQMGEPNFYVDRRRVAEIARRRQQVGQLLEAHTRWEKLQTMLADGQAMMDEPALDEESRLLIREELAVLEKSARDEERQLRNLMVPEDPDDSRNTIVEIRAGTGGDEASIFAGDLWRMYTRYAELRGWAVDPLSSHPSACGGFKEVIFSISGEDVYRFLKFESGVHRVQRIPSTEASGRIHTSTATVAVLPEAEEVDVQISPDELEITVCRASGPGGQGVNTTDSAVQILHRPTGMIVICADERSQQKNRGRAMQVLRARLLEKKQREERDRYATVRRRQVGSGDRSERIRTYNFPQSRLTDHRIGLTIHNLPQIMDGDLGMLLSSLLEADREECITAFLEA